MDLKELEADVLALGEALRRRGWRLATAESCTGGLIAAACTSVAGSSDWFERGFVSYSNLAKTQMLGVDAALVAAHGAVSEPVARAMAQGAAEIADVELAVAVTGIAGPGGGTPDKPVGLTYIHLSAVDAEWGERHLWQGDRLANKQQSAAAVLALLLRYVERQVTDGVGRAAGPPRPDTTPRGSEESVPVELVPATAEPATPHAFTWHGQRYQVAAVGRRWQAFSGGTTWHCLLVQTTGRDTFELRQRTDTGAWVVTQAWLQPRTA